MCAPKVPKPQVEKTPVRAASVAPDNGDPSVRSAATRRRGMTGTPLSSILATPTMAPYVSRLGMSGNSGG